MPYMSPVPVYATLLNASLGAGFLTVPWIFIQICSSSSVASPMIVDESSRAEYPLGSEKCGLPLPKFSMSLAFKRKAEIEVP